jgi:hypothetical protein
MTEGPAWSGLDGIQGTGQVFVILRALARRLFLSPRSPEHNAHRFPCRPETPTPARFLMTKLKRDNSGFRLSPGTNMPAVRKPDGLILIAGKNKQA